MKTDDLGMEYELTEASKKNSKTEILAVTEEANVDEAIPVEAKDTKKMEIHIKEGQNTQAYF